MDDKLLRFFDQMPEALPLYRKFEREEEQIDEELLGWVEEASVFSSKK